METVIDAVSNLLITFIGVLATAFLAWAGVVWRGTTVVKEGLTMLQVELAKMKGMIDVIREREDAAFKRLERIEERWTPTSCPRHGCGSRRSSAR